MRINSINQKNNRWHISITFRNENEEKDFLKKIIEILVDFLPVNCVLTDLDTVFSMYKEYFPRHNYFVLDNITYASICAYKLNWDEIKDVISNWGYYTLDAMFVFGNFRYEYKSQTFNCSEVIKCMPVVISQVLDYTLNINLEQQYFDKILIPLHTRNIENTGDGSVCWQ